MGKIFGGSAPKPKPVVQEAPKPTEDVAALAQADVRRRMQSKRGYQSTFLSQEYQASQGGKTKLGA
jgi:hypothetical protein